MASHRSFFDFGDPDFVLEELNEDTHLLDYHTIWSDPHTLAFSTRKPMLSLSQSRAFMATAVRAAHPSIRNFAIVLRLDSPLNPTNPASPLFPPPDTSTYAEHAPEGSEDQQAAPPPAAPRAPPDLHPTQRPYMAGLVGVHNPAPTRADPQPIGPGKHNTGAEVGYMLWAPFWGRGLGGRAVRGFAAAWWASMRPRDEVDPPGPDDEGEAERAARRAKAACLEAHIDPDNAASERLAASAGFVQSDDWGVEYTRAATGGKARLRIWRMRRPGT